MTRVRFWHFSWRRQRPQTLDGQRGPRGTCALQRARLLRGLLQPAGGRVYQRGRRGPGERRREVGRVPCALIAFVPQDTAVSKVRFHVSTC